MHACMHGTEPCTVGPNIRGYVDHQSKPHYFATLKRKLLALLCVHTSFVEKIRHVKVCMVCNNAALSIPIQQTCEEHSFTYEYA